MIRDVAREFAAFASVVGFLAAVWGGLVTLHDARVAPAPSEVAEVRP